MVTFLTRIVFVLLALTVFMPASPISAEPPISRMARHWLLTADIDCRAPDLSAN